MALAEMHRERARPDEPARLRPATARLESHLLSKDGCSLERLVRLRNGTVVRTNIQAPALKKLEHSEDDLAGCFDSAFLRSAEWPRIRRASHEVRVVDLFSGCGAISLGIWEACRAIGARAVPVMALDFNNAALEVYKKNFPEVWAVSSPIESILDSSLGARASVAERNLVARLGHVDVVAGGPPCQGHSDLNNHTRRNDPKNRLYERMARLAELVRPTHLIIENVSAVLHDKGRVVARTIAHLRRLGYRIDDAVVDAVQVGVPQRRRRHFVVASRERQPAIEESLRAFSRPARSVRWAIGDLYRTRRNGIFDQSAVPSSVNRGRIDYLFDHGLFELPDSMRPDCHRLKKHSYKSVYGRLHPEDPAQTITSGFSSMGQGRYVHPSQRRTLTAHEAARLQFIPDFFDFSGVSKRTDLAEMIGNAVPSKLAYVLSLELLR